MQITGLYRIVSWILLLICVGVSAGYSGNDTVEPIGITDLWLRQTAAFYQSALSRESIDARNEVHNFLIKNGVFRSPQISAAYMILGYRALDYGNRLDAQWAFNSALQVDPLNLEASNALLGNAFFLGTSEVISTIPVWFETAFRRLTAPGTRHLIAGNIALAIIYALIIFLVLTVIVVTISQYRLWVNDVLHALPFVSDVRFVSVALILAIVAVIATPAGMPGLLLITFTVAFIYAEKHQKRILWYASIGLVLVFPLSLIHVQSVLLESNTKLNIKRYALNGGFSDPAIKAIDTILQHDPDDVTESRMIYIRGLINKRGGFYSDAKEDFKQYEALNPRDAGVYINLANLEYINEDVQSAIAYYRRAESLDPHNPLIFFNLSKAYLSLFRFDEARNMQNRAMDLNRTLVNRLNQRYGSERVRMVADSGVPLDWLQEESRKTWKHAMNQTMEKWRIPFFEVTVLQAIIVWLSMILFALILRFLSHKFAFSRFCLKCGTAMKPHPVEKTADRICKICYMHFFKRHKLPDNTKKGNIRKKSLDRIYWKKLLHIFLSLIVPGSGRLYSGYIASGAVLMAIWSIALGYLVASRHMLPTCYRIPADTFFPFGMCAISVLVIIYLISIIWSFMEDTV